VRRELLRFLGFVKRPGQFQDGLRENNIPPEISKKPFLSPRPKSHKRVKYQRSDALESANTHSTSSEVAERANDVPPAAVARKTRVTSDPANQLRRHGYLILIYLKYLHIIEYIAEA
jgi:hypothetical protein